MTNREFIINAVKACFAAYPSYRMASCYRSRIKSYRVCLETGGRNRGASTHRGVSKAARQGKEEDLTMAKSVVDAARAALVKLKQKEMTAPTLIQTYTGMVFLWN